MSKFVYRTLSLFVLIPLLLSLFVSCEKKDKYYYTETYSSMYGDITISASYENNKTKYNDEKLAPILKKSAEEYIKYFQLLSESQFIEEFNSDNNVLLDCDENIVGVISEICKYSQNMPSTFQPFGGAYIDAEQSGDENKIIESLNHIGTDKVIIEGNKIIKSDKCLRINLYSYLKGYCVDMAVATLKKSGISHGRISVDGISKVFGSKPNGEIYTADIGDNGYLKITDGAIATVNSKTKTHSFGHEDGEFLKITVFSADAKTAQSVAHSLFSMTKDEALDFYNSNSVEFEAVMITKNKKKILTKRFENGTIYAEDTTKSN